MSTIDAGPLSREAVPAAFDAGASAYDRLVGANPGYHEHLRLSARRMRLPDGGHGLRLLDAGCGTGASTAALLAAAPHAEIVAFDASAEMLARARAKPWPASVTFVHSRAEELAGAGVDGPFDGILAAYLIRNLPDPDGQLRACTTCSGPAAPWPCTSTRSGTRAGPGPCGTGGLERDHPRGRAATGDASLYRYLWRSVDEFDGAARFRRRLREAGFTGVHSETMTGWQRGVVHTFLASRPSPPDQP